MPETDRCRTCSADVAVTRDEHGYPDQLDGSGDIVCDDCWEADQAAMQAERDTAR